MTRIVNDKTRARSNRVIVIVIVIVGGGGARGVERTRVSFERRKLQFHGGGARIVLEIDASLSSPLPPSSF